MCKKLVMNKTNQLGKGYHTIQEDCTAHTCAYLWWHQIMTIGQTPNGERVCVLCMQSFVLSHKICLIFVLSITNCFLVVGHHYTSTFGHN